jgi:carboxylesterase
MLRLLYNDLRESRIHMKRDKLTDLLLFPLDWGLGKSIDTLEKMQLLEKTSQLSYQGLKKILTAQFRLLNDLEIEGLEHIPAQGGLLLASNHQSWLDAQVLGAACQRRVHFIAKSEFKEWPLLKHLIKLSESVYVERGGDKEALQEIASYLRKGWTVAIFPEGTIPGEEDIPRRNVEPNTGLLRGRTGVIRLALMAGVPIVPVGISGTGRAFPPEIYPRLELLEMPSSTPIRIRFGQPIYHPKHPGSGFDRTMLRETTDQLMKTISSLVDHSANYAPTQVPIPKLPKKEKLGVLLLHGFTSHLDTVSGLVPYLKAGGIDYEMPILRGHGTRFEDLNGVTSRDWYIDAERALIDLWNRVDQVVIVGFSMGGLVALELACKHPGKVVAGVVLVAACLKFKNPLSRFSTQLSKMVKYWPNPRSFNDPSLGENSRNYEKFPSAAFASLYEYSRATINRLSEVHVPIRILQSKSDQVVAPVAANIIYRNVSSKKREIIWYEKSGHEMMQDLEAEKVFKDIMEFVNYFKV